MVSATYNGKYSCTALSSGPLTCQVSGLPIYHRLGYRTFTIRVKAVNGIGTSLPAITSATATAH